MLFINKIFIVLIFSLLMIFDLSAELKSLITKQPLSNIRFISRDGKFTYFKKRLGELRLSLNYDSKLVLSGDAFTNFNIYGSDRRKLLIVEKIPKYFSKNNIRSLNEIYVLDYGGSEVRKVGMGVSPNLLLGDNWISFFNFRTRIITVQSLIMRNNSYSIKIRNKINPYFIPQVTLINSEQVLFTDINDSGYNAIRIFNIISKEIYTVYKSSKLAYRLDFCLMGKKIFIGEFPYLNSSKKSSIFEVNVSKIRKNMRLEKVIYDSKYSDIGNLLCIPEKKYIYFVKNYKKENIEKDYNDVARISLPSYKLDRLTTKGSIGNIIKMDGRPMVPLNGKVYILSGKSNFDNDNFTKKIAK